MSPSILTVNSYKIYFWSNENNEPIHVHIAKGTQSPNSTKVWLTSNGGCLLDNNNSMIPQHDLNMLLKVIKANFARICIKWTQHFGASSIRFYI